MIRHALGLVTCTMLLAPTLALAADAVAVLTEIRLHEGHVEVRTGGAGQWTAARPLQALRPGDQVRATRSARAVVTLDGGRGARVVTESTSPYAVEAAVAAGPGDRLRSVVGGVTRFLLGQPRERTYQALSVRSLARAPLILAPRGARVLADQLVFEWSGPEALRYGIRVLSGGVVVWQRADLPRRPLAYPSSAPALAEGGRYSWELETREHGVLRVDFEVATATDAARVREALAALQDAAGSYPPATLALLRAGLMVREGVHADARRELITAIRANPDEAALHQLLGHVYERTGLDQLASHEFDEAERLTGR